MTRAAHTPPPWTIEDYGDDESPVLVIHRDSESRICFMATPGSHGDPALIEADAHLITAAPELLAFAKSLQIYRIEGDEEYLHVKFGNLDAVMKIHSNAAVLFLAIEAERSSVIAKATRSAP